MPPFGYALFLPRGIAPPEISMGDIYESIPPFVGLRPLALLLAIVFPTLAL